MGKADATKNRKALDELSVPIANAIPKAGTWHSLKVFLAFAITLPMVYYVIVLFHEWGHGTTAWLYGYKSIPFNIRYGGWLLLHCDEAVPYDRILKNGHGTQAALIGISGLTVTAALFLLSMLCINTRVARNSAWLLSALYWSCVLNMMAILGYIPLDTFSREGDVGRFVHGLAISPWLVFVPGTILSALCLYRLLGREIVKVYVFAPVRTTAMRRVLLGVSLALIFLFLYTHGYNPLTDEGTNTPSKILAGLSILLAPVLFVVCNPSRNWVLRAVDVYCGRERAQPDAPADGLPTD